VNKPDLTASRVRYTVIALSVSLYIRCRRKAETFLPERRSGVPERRRAHNYASPSLWLRGSGPRRPTNQRPDPGPLNPDPGRRPGCIRRDKYCPLAGAVAEGPAFLCVFLSWF
jgi:hypothetical protein